MKKACGWQAIFYCAKKDSKLLSECDYLKIFPV